MNKIGVALSLFGGSEYSVSMSHEGFRVRGYIVTGPASSKEIISAPCVGLMVE